MNSTLEELEASARAHDDDRVRHLVQAALRSILASEPRKLE
jgi:hypothetical protein